MGWIAALVMLAALVITLAALVILGFVLWRPEADKGWRDQAEGLRQRMERDGLPGA